MKLDLVPKRIKKKFTSESSQSNQNQTHEDIRPVVTMTHSYHQQCSELLTMKESVIRSLHDQIRTLSDQVESLKQGQDYRSHYVVEGTPHYVMQQRLANIRLEIQGWARMVLKSSKHSGNGNLGNRPLSDLLASDIPPYELQEGFKGVSPEKAVWHDLRDVKLQDLVAAIASNLIVRDAIVNPLRGCTPQMQEMAESSIYKAMTSEGASPEHRRAAKIWQASCLKYYRSSLQATDNLGTPQEKVEAMERQIDNVTTSVLMALKPVFDVCRLSGQSDSCQRKLRNTIFDATKVGTELAELQSGLVMMDKEWFQAHHTDEDGLISPPHLGSRVDLKLQIASGPSSGDPHDQEGVNRGKLALVLFPGLLKYGNDNGDNWESWTVWIQAKVLVTNVEMIKKETGLPRSQYQKPPPVLEEPGYHVITPGNAPGGHPVEASASASQYSHARSVPNRLLESLDITEGSQGILDPVVAHGSITQPSRVKDTHGFGRDIAARSVAPNPKQEQQDVDIAMAYGEDFTQGYHTNEIMRLPSGHSGSNSGSGTTAGGRVAPRPGTLSTTTQRGFGGPSTPSLLAHLGKSSINNTPGVFGLANAPVANIAPNTTTKTRKSGSRSPTSSPENKRPRQSGTGSYRYHPLDGMEGPDSGLEEDLDD